MLKTTSRFNPPINNENESYCSDIGSSGGGFDPRRLQPKFKLTFDEQHAGHEYRNAAHGDEYQRSSRRCVGHECARDDEYAVVLPAVKLLE